MNRFPAYFPNGCPPNDATDEEIELFRMCMNSTPTAEDFVSYYLQYPDKYKDDFRAYGLSVFNSEASCRKAFDKAPKLRARYKYCAKGMNNPDRGKTLSTPNKKNPHHITWWIYEGIEPHTFFVTCMEGGDDNG